MNGKKMHRNALKEETRIVLRENGIENHQRCTYLRKICHEITLSNSQILKNEFPQVSFQDNDDLSNKEKEIKAWSTAISFVIAYLKENNMNETIGAIKDEFRDKIIETRMSPDAYFKKITKKGPKRPPPLMIDQIPQEVKRSKPKMLPPISPTNEGESFDRSQFPKPLSPSKGAISAFNVHHSPKIGKLPNKGQTSKVVPHHRKYKATKTTSSPTISSRPLTPNAKRPQPVHKVEKKESPVPEEKQEEPQEIIPEITPNEQIGAATEASPQDNQSEDFNVEHFLEEIEQATLIDDIKELERDLEETFSNSALIETK